MRTTGIAVAGAAVAIYLLAQAKNVEAQQISKTDQDMAPTQNPTTSNESLPEIDPNAASIAAFLFMIRACEHRYPTDVTNNAAYGIFYGGARFSDFSDHPVITGEMQPVQLSDNMCIAAGLEPGCVSTAAGAYQLIRPTWKRIREISPRLEDFSPQSQDEAAIRLLDECGALRLIESGDIEGAIAKASKIWASLPGSKAKQNPKAMAYALNRYNDGLSLA